MTSEADNIPETIITKTKQEEGFLNRQIDKTIDELPPVELESFKGRINQSLETVQHSTELECSRAHIEEAETVIPVIRGNNEMSEGGSFLESTSGTHIACEETSTVPEHYQAIGASNLIGNRFSKDKKTVEAVAEKEYEENQDMDEAVQKTEKENKGHDTSDVKENIAQKATTESRSLKVVGEETPGMTAERAMGHDEEALLHASDLTVESLNDKAENVTDACNRDGGMKNASSIDAPVIQTEQVETNLRVEEHASEKSANSVGDEKDQEKIITGEKTKDEKHEKETAACDIAEDGSISARAASSSIQTDNEAISELGENSKDELDGPSVPVASVSIQKAGFEEGQTIGEVAVCLCDEDSVDTGVTSDQMKDLAQVEKEVQPNDDLEVSSVTKTEEMRLQIEENSDIFHQVSETQPDDIVKQNPEPNEAFQGTAQHDGIAKGNGMDDENPEAKPVSYLLKCEEPEHSKERDQASSENADSLPLIEEEKTIKPLEKSLEEKGDREKPTNTNDITEKEISIEKVIPDENQNAEVDFPNRDVGDVQVHHSLIEETMQVESENNDYIFKSEPEQVQESNRASVLFVAENKDTGNKLEASQSTENTELEISTEGGAAIELNTRKGESMVTMDSKGNLDVTDAESIVETKEEAKLDNSVLLCEDGMQGKDKDLTMEEVSEIYSEKNTGHSEIIEVEENDSMENLKHSLVHQNEPVMEKLQKPLNMVPEENETSSSENVSSFITEDRPVNIHDESLEEKDEGNRPTDTNEIEIDADEKDQTATCEVSKKSVGDIDDPHSLVGEMIQAESKNIDNNSKFEPVEQVHEWTGTSMEEGNHIRNKLEENQSTKDTELDQTSTEGAIIMELNMRKGEHMETLDSKGNSYVKDAESIEETKEEAKLDSSFLMREEGMQGKDKDLAMEEVSEITTRTDVDNSQIIKVAELDNIENLKHSLVQQNETVMEKLQKPMNVASEQNETSSSENVDSSAFIIKEKPIKTLESLKEKEEEDKPTDTNETKIDADKKNQTAEVECSNENVDNINVPHSLVGETMQAESENLDKISKVEIGEHVIESNRTSMEDDKHIENRLEAKQSIENTELEQSQQTSIEGAITMELDSKTMDSKGNTDVKNAEKNIEETKEEAKHDSSFMLCEENMHSKGKDLAVEDVSEIITEKNIDNSQINEVTQCDNLEDFIDDNEQVKKKLQNSVDMTSNQGNKTTTFNENADSFTFAQEKQPIKNLEERLEAADEEDKPTDTSDITEKIDADEENQTAEVEFSNKNVGDKHVPHSLIEEITQVEGEKTENISKLKTEEQVHESNDASIEEERDIGNKLEANRGIADTMQEQAFTEGEASVKLQTRTSENTETSTSNINLDLNDAENIEETEKERDYCTDRNNINTTDDETEEGTVKEYGPAIAQSGECAINEKVELSCQAEVVEETERVLNGIGEGQREPEEDAKHNIEDVHHQIADRGEVTKEIISEGDSLCLSPEPIEGRMDSQDNRKEDINEQIITESSEKDLSLDFIGAVQIQNLQDNKKESEKSLEEEPATVAVQKESSQDNEILEKTSETKLVNQEGSSQAASVNLAPTLAMTKDGRNEEKYVDTSLEKQEESMQAAQVNIDPMEAEIEDQRDEGKSSPMVGNEDNNNGLAETTETVKIAGAKENIEEVHCAKEQNTTEGNDGDHSQDFVREGSVYLQGDEKSTTECKEEESEVEAGESISYSMSRDNQCPEKILDISLVKQEATETIKIAGVKENPEEVHIAKEQNITEGNDGDHSQDFVREDSVYLHADEKSMVECKEEELETKAGESISYSTNQDNQSPEKILDTSSVKQEESSQVHNAIKEDERDQEKVPVEDITNDVLVEAREIINSDDTENEAEKEDYKDQVTKEGNFKVIAQDLVGEPLKDFPCDDEKVAERSNEETIQESENVTVDESITDKTSRDNEGPKMISDTSLVKGGESLQVDKMNTAPIEDKRDEEKSSVATGGKHDNALVDDKEESGKKMLKNVEYMEQILQEDDHVEKTEGLANEKSENTPSTIVEKIPITEEEVIQNPVKASEEAIKCEEIKMLDDVIQNETAKEEYNKTAPEASKDSKCTNLESDSPNMYEQTIADEINREQKEVKSVKDCSPESTEMETIPDSSKEDRACNEMETAISSMIPEKESTPIESLAELSPSVAEEAIKHKSKDDENNMMDLKQEVNIADPGIIEQTEATSPIETKEIEIFEGRTGTNKDIDTFNTAEAMASEEVHPVESNESSLQPLNSTVPEIVIKEGSLEKEKSTLHDSDSPLIAAVVEETHTVGAEPEDKKQVKTFDLVIEGNSSVSTGTEGASLVTANNNVKLQENSNLEELMDKDVLATADEATQETEQGKQDEAPSTRRDMQKEVGTSKNPSDGKLAETIQDSGMMPLEEHDPVPVEERDEPTCETEKIPFSVTEENLLKREDELTTQNVVPELRPSDVENNENKEVQKHLDEEPDTPLEPRTEKNTPESERRESDDHATQSEVYKLETQKGDEELNLGAQKNKFEEELPTNSSKYTELGTTTETEKDTLILEDSAVSSKAGAKIERATAEVEATTLNDTEKQTQENLQSTESEGKLECTSELEAGDERNVILPETDHSQSDEKNNIDQDHNWKFVEEQIIRQQFTEGERETGDQIDNTDKQKKNANTVVFNDEVNDGVEKEYESENFREKVTEEENKKDSHIISPDVETVDQVQVSGPVSTQYLNILDSEQKEPGTSEKEIITAQDLEAKINTSQGVSDACSKAEVQSLESEPREKLNAEAEKAETTLCREIIEPSVGGEQLDEKPVEDFCITPDEKVLETTEPSLHCDEVDSVKLEETSPNLVAQLSAFDHDETEKESIAIEDSEENQVNRSQKDSNTFFESKDQIVKGTAAEETGTIEGTKMPEKTLGGAQVDDKAIEIFVNTSDDRHLETSESSVPGVINSMILGEASTNSMLQLTNLDTEKEDKKSATMEDPETSEDCYVKATKEKLAEEKLNANKDDATEKTETPEMRLRDSQLDDKPTEDFPGTSEERASKTTEPSLQGDGVDSIKNEESSSHEVSQLSTRDHDRIEEESITVEDTKPNEVDGSLGVSDAFSVSKDCNLEQAEETGAEKYQTAEKLDTVKTDSTVRTGTPETSIREAQVDDKPVDDLIVTSDERFVETVEITKARLHSDEADSMKPEETSFDPASPPPAIDRENAKQGSPSIEITDADKVEESKISSGAFFESNNQGDEVKNESSKSVAAGMVCVNEATEIEASEAAETTFGEAQSNEESAKALNIFSNERSLETIETTEASLPGEELDSTKLEETTSTFVSQVPTIDGKKEEKVTAEVQGANEVQDTHIFSDVVYASKEEAAEEIGENLVVKRLDAETPTAIAVETSIREVQLDDKPVKAITSNPDERSLDDTEMSEASLQGKEIDDIELEETTSDRLFKLPIINHGNTETGSVAADEDEVENSKLSSDAVELNNQGGQIDETEEALTAEKVDADQTSETVTRIGASLEDTQLEDKLQKSLTTTRDECSLGIIGTTEAALQGEGGDKIKLEDTASNLVFQLPAFGSEDAEKEKTTEGTCDVDKVEETKISSDAVNEFKDYDGEETEQSLIIEKITPDECFATVTDITEDAGLKEAGQSLLDNKHANTITSAPNEGISETVEALQDEVETMKLEDNSHNLSKNDHKNADEDSPNKGKQGAEGLAEIKEGSDAVLDSEVGLIGPDITGKSLDVNKIENETAAGKIPTAEKLEEKLQISTSAFPIDEHEQKNTITVRKIEEENMKEMKTLEDHSTTMALEEPCLQEEEDRKLKAPTQGTQLNKGLRDSPRAKTEEEDRPDGVLQLQQQEDKDGIKNVSSQSDIEQMTELTRSSKDASIFKSETSEESSKPVLEVCSHEVFKKSEDTEIIHNEVPDAKVTEKEVAKGQQEDELNTEEIPGDKIDEISQITTVGTRNEELIEESKSRHTGEDIEERVETEDKIVKDSDLISIKKEADKDWFPDEHERKDSEGAAIKSNLENQNFETYSGSTTGKANLAHEESGIEIPQGTMVNREDSKIAPHIDQQEQSSHLREERQLPKETLNDNIEAMISTMKEEVPPNLKELDAETRELGNVTEVDSEVKRIAHGEGNQRVDLTETETEGSTLTDSNKISLSELLQKSKEETLQVAGHSTEQEESTAHQEEMKTQVTETMPVGEPKSDEEDGEEHEKTDPGSDAPVIVESSRDIDVKATHKKSHGILSGVGSKVKHSISKVKKVITGKSSHPKTLSPK